MVYNFFVTLQIYTISPTKATKMDKEVPLKMTVLGLMSGTSLDGLDMALCEFNYLNDIYTFKIVKAKTIEYDKTWKDALANAKDLGAEKYFRLHSNYGSYIGEEINKFLKEVAQKPFAIASHGHTVFHQPNLGFTTQIGCGATIAAQTKITTVCDFRILDIANGGQGAPLVPIGDKLLFAEYDACLNIGGIANVSFEKNDERIAYDICFANMALNFLAEKNNKSFDEGGKMAAAGEINPALLEELKQNLKKENYISLAREQFEKNCATTLNNSKISIEDKLATVCEYVSDQIAESLSKNETKNVLVTGGGAYNTHLVNSIKTKFNGSVIVPDDETIQFKEALIFAFLGYLRLHEKTNTLKSVTSAGTDSVGGAVYFS